MSEWEVDEQEYPIRSIQWVLNSLTHELTMRGTIEFQKEEDIQWSKFENEVKSPVLLDGIVSI